MTDLPTIPIGAAVIELDERNAPRTCEYCSADAEFYVFVTPKQAGKHGVPASLDEWPVNTMLCRDHFRDAPRVKEVSELA